MRLLTLCGSLRAHSSNRAILRAFERLAPAEMSFEHFERMGDLPHFNPDLDDAAVLPQEAAEWRRMVGAADVMLISTPEYAHGLPGSFKNALDWLVSDPAFVGKHVVILSAARGSARAQDSLREVLRTMSAKILEAASISLPLGSSQADVDSILARDDLRTILLCSGQALLGGFNKPDLL